MSHRKTIYMCTEITNATYLEAQVELGEKIVISSDETYKVLKAWNISK